MTVTARARAGSEVKEDCPVGPDEVGEIQEGRDFGKRRDIKWVGRKGV